MPVLRISLVLLFCATTLASADELRTVSGKTVKGTVTAITDKDVTLQTDTGPVTTPLAEILALDLRPVRALDDKTTFSEVRLLDGTLLRCTSLALKAKTAEMTLLSGQQFNVPLDRLVTYLKDAQDNDLRKEWESLLTEKPKRDRLLVKAGDGDLKALECTVLAVDDKGETVKVRRTNDQVIDVAVTKLQGIVFYRDEKAPDNVVCQVVDVQGNSLAAAKVAVTGGNYTVTTSGGVTLTFDAKNIARFDYNIGKLSYLSDLALAKAPVRKSGGKVFDSFSDDIRKDLNIDGQPIVFGGTTYNKGLSLHAYTEIEYDLGGKYKKFKAVLGIPQESEQPDVFQPRVTIELDGVKRFSEVVTAKGTVPVELNLEGVQRLRIIVSSSNVFDLYDSVTLADAKVTQ
jgi:hypothetical protein